MAASEVESVWVLLKAEHCKKRRIASWISVEQSLVSYRELGVKNEVLWCLLEAGVNKPEIRVRSNVVNRNCGWLRGDCECRDLFSIEHEE